MAAAKVEQKQMIQPTPPSTPKAKSKPKIKTIVEDDESTDEEIIYVKREPKKKPKKKTIIVQDSDSDSDDEDEPPQPQPVVRRPQNVPQPRVRFNADDYFC